MKIGLTYTGADWKHANYVRWLKAEGEGIEVVRLEAGGGGSIIGCDGLVLSGGVDIYPGFYGGGVDYPGGGGWKPERDAFELEMLEAALAKGLPVLGVCRGLQLINVSQKGTLVQDLGPAGDAVHQNMPDDKEHAVVVDAGTLLDRVTGVEGLQEGVARLKEGVSGLREGVSGLREGMAGLQEEMSGLQEGVSGLRRGMVNSAHHQAVERLGMGFRVNCRAEDGTIEGIEWAEPEGRAFLLAVQWHPERMFVNGVGDKVFWRAVRDRFVGEVGKGKA
ncbi:MAG TPA: gamma-glutamyl-gamma-aminobutyrate hydrolase family protein [Puia sp.]|nr:gamma-glutamyl-gamma-aminobutyrate hydrolase family protein [Puia sp.]